MEDRPYGGCSAKIDPLALGKLLSGIAVTSDPNVMVGLSTCDDAGVYRLNDETALIVTTDFFPPVVDDPFTFGRIAATNALSDVYAMGGKPLLSLNLTHYPSKRLSLEGLREILRGGQEAVEESGAITIGGHTIEDETTQYGLAVVGTVHPKKLITNAGACPGQKLILTKPLGIGVQLAGKRLDLTPKDSYQLTVETMCRLNRYAAEIMTEAGVRTATDVTGFGLIGHAWEMARASAVGVEIETSSLPCIDGSLELLDDGCIPGAAFRNIRYVGDALQVRCSTNQLYLSADPQTSGGLLMAVDSEHVDSTLQQLHAAGETSATVIGSIVPTSAHGAGVCLL